MFIIINTRVRANTIIPEAARAKDLDINISLFYACDTEIFDIHFTSVFHTCFDRAFRIIMFVGLTIIQHPNCHRHRVYMYFTSLIKTKVHFHELLGYHGIFNVWLIYMSFIWVLKYTLCMNLFVLYCLKVFYVNVYQWLPNFCVSNDWVAKVVPFEYVVFELMFIPMIVYKCSLFNIVCMCVGGMHLRLCPYTRTCYQHTRVYTFI